MDLTIGFIAFFISIIIPGILFRRFFFFGEFSKQFNTKDPVLHSIFFSIVPGIIIQLLCFTFYCVVIKFDSKFLDIFTIFRDITSDGEKGIEEITKTFINNDIPYFFIYSICVFLFSAFIGSLSSRLIRYFNWDKKHKLFRFKNQWYYIFSGEVLNMRKFKDAHNVSFRQNKGVNQDTLMTYADILVSVSDESSRKELYTGYVVDYDLKSDDITQLDKIYLIDTHRYKKKSKAVDDDGVEIKDKQEVNANRKPTSSMNRIRIPGDVFILDANRIKNLNLTYIPSVKKKQDKKLKEEKKQSFFLIVLIAYFVILSLLILSHFLYKLVGLDKTFLGSYYSEIGFWGKLITILFINQILSLCIPTWQGRKLVYIFKKEIWYYVFALAYGVLFYYLVIAKLIT